MYEDKALQNSTPQTIVASCLKKDPKCYMVIVKIHNTLEIVKRLFYFLNIILFQINFVILKIS